jgi:hypothetical protein
MRFAIVGIRDEVLSKRNNNLVNKIIHYNLVNKRMSQMPRTPHERSRGRDVQSLPSTE